MGTRVVIMAGGTGGHVFPALAVAEELRARDCEVTWLGTRRGVEARVVPPAGFMLDTVTVSGIRGKNWHQRAMSPFLAVLACVQVLGILARRRPQVVLGMGGFVSGPGGVVARLLGIPLVIHEQNGIPGTTNRWLAKLANKALEAFPGVFAPKVGAECTGNPLRRALVQGIGERRTRQQGQPLHLLVLGGSQGAKVLNQVVPDAAAKLRCPVQIRHQTGAAMRDETDAQYRALGVPAAVDAFIEDMAEAYRWADIAVCRAGAMTASELAAAGLPAVMVPYPYAIDDHQSVNARILSDAGGGVCLPQTQLDPERLAMELNRLAADPDRLQSMGERVRGLARLDAAERVAEVCLRESSQ